MYDLHTMIKPSRSPHFLTDRAETPARNDGGSSHRDAAFSPLRGNQHCCDPHVAYSLAQSVTIDAVSIVCPHCCMLYFGHPQRWHDARCCRAVPSHPAPDCGCSLAATHPKTGAS